MERSFGNKLTDVKKQEQDRRTELAMMYLLMEKYPNQAGEKLWKFSSELRHKTNNHFEQQENLPPQR